jgi:hypothetical protein
MSQNSSDDNRPRVEILPPDGDRTENAHDPRRQWIFVGAPGGRALHIGGLSAALLALLAVGVVALVALIILAGVLLWIPVLAALILGGAVLRYISRVRRGL